MNLFELQQIGIAELGSHLEADILLAYCLEAPRSRLYAYPNQIVSLPIETQYRTLLHRRVLGEPIAYITGKKEFWSLELDITSAVLIPRSETELLVEVALKVGSELQAVHSLNTVHVLDLGTGSGAIAIAIASERPHWKITAIDKSPAAIELAQHNAKKFSLTHIQFYTGNWFEPLELLEHPMESDRIPSFDIIVSNPPYIAMNDPHLEMGDLRFEPKTALISGSDGLKDLEMIVFGAKKYLKESGVLILEHGFDQGTRLSQCMHAAGYDNIQTLKDLASLDRVTLGYHPLDSTIKKS